MEAGDSARVQPPLPKPAPAAPPARLAGPTCTLRSLETGDAPALHDLLSTPAVTRFMPPPPNGVDGFKQFISWAERQREVGRSYVYGVVPADRDEPVGFFQLHSVNRALRLAEWGFAIGEPYWGSGLFPAGAALMLDLAFETIGINRLEARAGADNQRANRALRKVGAVAECRLRRSFLVEDGCQDDVLWSILAHEWRRRSARPEVAHIPDSVPAERTRVASPLACGTRPTLAKRTRPHGSVCRPAAT